MTVEFTYLDTDHLDENGNPTPVTPLPLFRPADSSLPPGVTNDGKLRRYVDFELPDSYTDKLTKYYDGEPFPSLPLPFEAPDGHNLTDSGAITYKYQRLDANGDPIGPELESHDPSGASQMPSDVGSMKFTAISTQYSNDTGFWKYVETLGMRKEDFSRAIDMAPSIKPHRHTYLHEQQYREQAKRLLTEDDILNRILI